MASEHEQEARNRALVLAAFDALFNRRDFEAAERCWAPDYVQHGVGIGPGRDGLFALVRSVRRQYESGLAVAEGDYVMVHGRFSGGGRPTKIAVDILRIEGGRLAEHWDVIQDEATRAESKSGLPMFGNRFPDARHRTARETNMTTHAFDGERVTLTTTRKFSDVVAHIDRALGHPNIAELFCKIQAAQTPDEVNEVVAAAAGPLQLMEFMRLDFGLMLRKDKQPVDRNALRFIIGNPVIMREMVRGTPDAGSYAPVTVLLDERAGGVQLSYDRVASLLAAYGDPHALQVARDLDAKVEGLLYEAAGQAPDKP